MITNTNLSPAKFSPTNQLHVNENTQRELKHECYTPITPNCEIPGAVCCWSFCCASIDIQM